MSGVAAILLVLVAGLFGAVLQRRLFRGRDPESSATRMEGMPVSELVIPIRTLVALVLAFVLVQTFSSYQDASDHAAEEAGAVLSESQSAELLRPGVGRPVVGALRCYARSVAGPEWNSMEDSRSASPATDDASRRVSEALIAAERARPDPTVMAAVLDADDRRVSARRGRLDEAQPSVPGLVTALMIFGAVVVVVLEGAFAHPAVRRGMRIALLVATATIFTATLLVILDVDHPFGGFASIEPTAMQGAEDRIADSTLAPPPCDRAGTPTRNPA